MLFVNVFGRKVITVSTKQQTIDIPKSVVADANANPIITAAICTFKVVDSEKAALDVEDYLDFVKSQAVAVLKQVASKYPYSSDDGVCLKDETAQIGETSSPVFEEDFHACVDCALGLQNLRDIVFRHDNRFVVRGLLRRCENTGVEPIVSVPGNDLPVEAGLLLKRQDVV